MKKPSVTQLIDQLNKPALLDWANRIGLQGISLAEHRKASKAKGASLHNQIENCLKYGEPLFDPEHQLNFEEFLIGKKILGFEESIETDAYTGRFDLRFMSNEQSYIADFKSGKTVYLETILQLVAYRRALNCTDKLAMICIPDFRIIPITVKDFAPYETILDSLVAIYKAKSTIGRV